MKFTDPDMGAIHWLNGKLWHFGKKNMRLNQNWNWGCWSLKCHLKAIMIKSGSIYVLDTLGSKVVFYNTDFGGLNMLFFLFFFFLCSLLKLEIVKYGIFAKELYMKWVHVVERTGTQTSKLKTQPSWYGPSHIALHKLFDYSVWEWQG